MDDQSDEALSEAQGKNICRVFLCVRIQRASLTGPAEHERKGELST